MLYDSDFLAHDGRDKEHTSVPNGPGSGRYEKGTGKNPFQHGSGTFYEQVLSYRAMGYSDKEIAEKMGMKTGEFRAQFSLGRSQQRLELLAQVKQLQAEGKTNSEIGQIIGKNESVVRSMLKPEYEANLLKTRNTADVLKTLISEKKYLDVGAGAELELGVADNTLDNAILMLQNEGYKKHYLKVPQVTDPNHFTWVTVMTEPDVEWKEVYENQDKIQGVGDYTSDDNGSTFRALKFPASVDSSRILVRFNEEGGAEKDGVIELRRGVEDLSLGNSHYAQVRIAVDGKYYMKGMAIYSNDIPDGYDIIYNSHRELGTPLFEKDATHSETVYKKMKIDPSTGEIDQFNPFGATIMANGQSEYLGKDGKMHLSSINKINEEGKWGDWSKTLSSQFLSKQSLPLLKRQLDVSYADKADQLDEIMKLTNPEVKKYYLEQFASDCDGAAVHLKAAGFERQASHVIIPVNSLKDDEIYAPNYSDGQKVALIRYPHTGTFEIPVLTVNNKNKEGLDILGPRPEDAVGININVASRLSGADFDGDTVTVIPMSSRVKITSIPQPKALKGFDPQAAYPAYEGMPKTGADTGFNKQREMGIVSNLITDMTLKGATIDELVPAVKHSMVVIDAEKHNLDWRQSEIDNNINALKKRWQDGGGADTLVSRSKGEKRVSKEDEYAMKGITEKNTDPNTGERIHIYKPEYYTVKKVNKRTGEVTTVEKERKVVTTNMASVKDAYELLSKNPNPKEIAYADYANSLKALANTARKEYLATPSVKKDPSAAKVYAVEVASINSKLNDALKNAPKERLAQIRANQVYQNKLRANPNMDKDERKKIKDQALAAARNSVGSVSRKNRGVTFTDREWEAIQAHAISPERLRTILNNSDPDKLRVRAMPNTSSSALSDTKIARIKAYANSGKTQAEIAKALGISTSAVSRVLRGT